MPNRYVREDAIESDRVNAMSWQGEVFFRRLINRVDDFGRFSASIPILRASLFPLQLARVSDKDVARLLIEAEANGLLATYDVNGKRFLALAKWEQGRAKGSKYPPPPDNIRERLQTYVYGSMQMQTDVPDSDSDSDSDSNTDTDTGNSPWLVAHGLELPESLRTEPCLAAVKLWLRHKAEKRSGYKPTGLQSAMKQWANEFTAATFPSAVEHSIAKDWKGIYSPTNGHHNPRPSSVGSSVVEQRNATLGSDVAAHAADARARARAIDEANAKRFEETGLTPFDADPAEVSGESDGPR
jgi:hypothetical protein